MSRTPQVSVITGAASGIGKASAIRFAAAGGKVVVADIDGVGAKQVAEEIGAGALAVTCDVAEERDIIQAVEAAVDSFGRLDVMVNNAGIGGAMAPLVDTSVEDWDRVQAVLLRGTFLGIKHAGRQMIAQGEGGSIVNISSIAGLIGGCGLPPYSAAKAGIVGLTRSAALELAEHKIRVNAICPGGIITPLLVGGPIDSSNAEGIIAHFDMAQPIPDHGLPEDVAAGIEYLASDGARFVTGQQLTIDGGTVAAGPMAAMKAMAAASAAGQ